MPVTEAKVRLLVAGLSLQRPGFNPNVLHTELWWINDTDTGSPNCPLVFNGHVSVFLRVGRMDSGAVSV